MDMTWIAGLVTAFLAGIAAVITALYKRNQNKQDQYKHEERLIEISSGQNEIKQDIKSIAAAIVKLNQNQVSTDKMLLRNAILTIYFNYEKEKAIPEAQYESVLGLYDVYTSLNGNGFVHEKVDEIKTWRRI